MEDGEREEILGRLREFLCRTINLQQPEADIYILGLRTGAVRSSDVVKHVKGMKNATTAKDRLDRLTRAGYFEQTAGEAVGGVGKKGKPIIFRAVPPSIALRKPLAAAKETIRDLERLDELLEIGAEMGDEDDVWIIRDEDAALGRVSKAIEAASSEVLVHCRDGTWWKDEGIKGAMAKAAARGVTVRVAGTEIDGGTSKAMAEAGVRVVACRAPMPPCFVVDRSIAFLPHRTGKLATRYSALRLGNRYLVQNLAASIVHEMEAMEK